MDGKNELVSIFSLNTSHFSSIQKMKKTAVGLDEIEDFGYKTPQREYFNA